MKRGLSYAIVLLLLVNSSYVLAQSQAEIEMSLIAHYDFLGSKVPKTIGNGLEMANVVYSDDAVLGKVAYFNGVDSVAKVSNIPNYNGEAYTYSFWMKSEKDFDDRDYEETKPVWFYYASTNGMNHYFYLHESGSSAFLQSSSNQVTSVYKKVEFKQDEWVHYAISYSSDNEIKLYINGVLVNTPEGVKDGIGPSSSTGVLTIGASPYGNYFEGNIYDFRIYSEDLSNNMINKIYTLTKPTPKINYELTCENADFNCDGEVGDGDLSVFTTFYTSQSGVLTQQIVDSEKTKCINFGNYLASKLSVGGLGTGESSAIGNLIRSCKDQCYAVSVDKDNDNVLSAQELSRLTGLYNAGEYFCDASSEDGFSLVDNGDQTCMPHSVDLNQDWIISYGELSSIAQIFNSGGSYICPGRKLDCESYGDIDGDGMITRNDAYLVSDQNSAKIKFSSTQLKNADVNGDGEISSGDEATILAYFVKSIDHFPICVSKEPPCNDAGDVDGDGDVDVIDSKMILRYFLDLEELTPSQLSRADVSGDSNDVKVTPGDAGLILSYLEGRISTFPVCEKLEDQCYAIDVDLNKDGMISSEELLPISGLAQSGGMYYCDSTTSDGYTIVNNGNHNCDYHSVDQNKDWIISALELHPVSELWKNAESYSCDILNQCDTDLLDFNCDGTLSIADALAISNVRNDGELNSAYVAGVECSTLKSYLMGLIDDGKTEVSISDVNVMSTKINSCLGTTTLPVCVDSDGGLDYYVRGTINLPFIEQFDAKYVDATHADLSPGFVMNFPGSEISIVEVGKTYTFQSTGAPFSFKVNEITQQDHPNGLNALVKITWITRSDNCVGNTLFELSCNLDPEGGDDDTFFNCPYGCSEGACLPRPGTSEALCVDGTTKVSPTIRVELSNPKKLNYCDPRSLTFKPTVDNEKSCLNDYECSSNACIDGECVSLRLEIQKQTSILNQILCFVKKIFGSNDPTCTGA